MARSRLGILLWSQATPWRPLEEAARRADRLGYHSLWSWDHMYPIYGSPDQPVFEAYTTLAVWSKVTSRVRLGLLVGANTFRSPAVVAKMLTTIDHTSAGRAIAGLGAAWFEAEHAAFGLDFGRGAGERLAWLEESAEAIRALFAGERVTSRSVSQEIFAARWSSMATVERQVVSVAAAADVARTLRRDRRGGHAPRDRAAGDVDRREG